MFLSTKMHVANHLSLTNHPSQTMYKKAKGFGSCGMVSSRGLETVWGLSYGPFRKIQKS